MNPLYIILLGLQLSVLGVKIGVSKLSTTSTTTISPNILTEEINSTVTTPTIVPTTSEVETTYATETKDFGTTTAQFPPKVAKPTAKTTTTPKATTTATTLNPDNGNNSANATSSGDMGLAKAYPMNFYCYCDMNPSVCDINCCCDNDCPKSTLKVFNCFRPSKYPELRLRLEDFQYEHGLPSCKINDGWLCVFRTNTRPPAEKVYEFNFDTTHNYKWPTSLMDMAEADQFKERDYYKFGEHLKVINMDSLEVENFEIPYSFKPPYCHLNDPIRHLKLVSRNCLLPSLAAAQENKRKILNLVTRSKVLSKPRAQITDLNDQEHLTRDFIVKNCILNSEDKEHDCSEWDTSYNETETYESENYYTKKIQIIVWHNFTNLQACEIKFMEQEFSSNEGVCALWQKFTVSFIPINGTDSVQPIDKSKMDTHLSFSGPLGYLQGEPIIVSKFMPNNESEELSAHNRVLNYFKHRSSFNNTLNVLSRREGRCHRNNNKDSGINYGISSLTQCMLRIEMKYLTKLTSRSLKKSNFTELCVQMQQQIIATLFGEHVTSQLNELGELFVSKLGRPQNSSDKWLPLQVLNLEFAPIVGQLTADYQTLICRNILLNAAYEFHIGTFTEHGISQQALVKNALLKFGQRHDLEFTLDEPLEVPLALTVMFYDLSLNVGADILWGFGYLHVVSTFVCVILNLI